MKAFSGLLNWKSPQIGIEAEIALVETFCNGNLIIVMRRSIHSRVLGFSYSLPKILNNNSIIFSNTDSNAGQ